MLPRIKDYFGVWAINEVVFSGLCTYVANFMQEHGDPAQVDVSPGNIEHDDYIMRLANGVGVLAVDGVLMKYPSSGASGSSTVLLRQCLRMLARDPAISSIVMRVDSPGGSVKGIDDLAQDIRKIDANIKPVYAYVEDQADSAGYYLASQARKIVANRAAEVGCVGVYSVVLDTSEKMKKEGIKPIVIKDGAYKAIGVDGTINEEQLAYMQGRVNEVSKRFTETVLARRKIDPKLFDGRSFSAPEALTSGFIDAIEDFDTFLGNISNHNPNQKTGKVKAMAAEENQASAPAPATYQELKDSLKGASNDFICACLGETLTLDAAKNKFMEHLAAENERLRAESEKPKTSPNAAPIPTAQVASEQASGESPREQWNRLIEAEIAKGAKATDALKTVNLRNPGLRERMLEAAGQVKE